MILSKKNLYNISCLANNSKYIYSFHLQAIFCCCNMTPSTYEPSILHVICQFLVVLFPDFRLNRVMESYRYHLRFISVCSYYYIEVKYKRRGINTKRIYKNNAIYRGKTVLQRYIITQGELRI